MATQRFQKVAAVALLLLLIIPGASWAQLLQDVPAAADPVPVAPQLADHAFGLALKDDGLADILGPYLGVGLPHNGASRASDLQAMQPTLEAVLRYYAQDRGLTLTPPRTPDVSAPDALSSALAALAALKGQVLTPDELDQARQLDPELQQALARIVLSYVQAVHQYTEAIAGLTQADALALLQGQAPQHAPDGGKIASAALLVD
ncbi:MAG: hypothetical protein LC624_11915, partial [Halobacteriales archaeon]|nr:hypothetical protein [Halobacteriales archaeon]